MKTTAVTVSIHAACCFCAVLIAVIASGCATPAVWRDTAATRWFPQPPVDVLLLPTTNQNPQVAFRFTQSTRPSKRGETAKTRPVLWLPEPSATNLVVGDSAIRAFLKSRPTPLKVPVYGPSDQLPTSSAGTGAFAIRDPNGITLTLHAESISPGPYTMPATDQKVQTAARIIGLPLAVTFDAALVAAVVTLAAIAGMGGGCGGASIPSF